MSISKARARKLAKRILRDNKKGRSYRVMTREDYPMLGADGKQIIKPGTLNRFANSRGEWVPKDCEILVALGLKKPLEPRPLLPPWFHQTPEALEWFTRKKERIKQMSRETRQSAKRRS
jgi:hypothetical protein